MTLQSSLKAIGEALAGLSVRVYHYYRPAMVPPFVVWAEDGEASALGADDHKAEQAISGWIDYYTLIEFDPAVDEIQHLLNTLPIAWRLNTVDYEDETNLIHYSWTFGVGNGVV